MEKQELWKDQNGNYRCDSCGKIVKKEELLIEKNLGYCKECFQEIQNYQKKLKEES